MKNILLLCLLLSTGALIAQDGIQFTPGPWHKILQKAQKENKLIFLDAYTTWCGPCRMMAKDVFPNKSLGKYYNENFINVQMDMESDEGRRLASKYDVEAFPSLLYIDSKGEEVHRVIGYHESEQLLEVGEIAKDEDKCLKCLEKRFEAGEREVDFLLKLAMAHSNAMDGKHMEPLEAYFDLQSDWTTMENMELIFMLADDIKSPLFKYFAKHRSEFELVFGKAAVVNKLQQIVSQNLQQDDSDAPSLEKVDELYEQAYPDLADKLSSRFRIDYYRMAGDMDKYLDATAKYLENYSSEDAMELNNAAWNFFELVEDPEKLQLALGWARKSTELEAAYYNYDTLASLYFKLGENKKALKTAKEAIKIAKANGEDYQMTKALLQAIKAR